MDQRRLAETLARDHGDHPGVNYLRGMIDLRLGDGAAALRFFEMAHEADEDYLPVRRELGLLMLDGSRFEEAMDVLPSDLEVFGAVEYLFDRLSGEVLAQRHDRRIHRAQVLDGAAQIDPLRVELVVPIWLPAEFLQVRPSSSL